MSNSDQYKNEPTVAGIYNAKLFEAPNREIKASLAFFNKKIVLDFDDTSILERTYIDYGGERSAIVDRHIFGEVFERYPHPTAEPNQWPTVANDLSHPNFICCRAASAARSNAV